MAVLVSFLRLVQGKNDTRCDMHTAAGACAAVATNTVKKGVSLVMSAVHNATPFNFKGRFM